MSDAPPDIETFVDGRFGENAFVISTVGGLFPYRKLDDAVQLTESGAVSRLAATAVRENRRSGKDSAVSGEASEVSYTFAGRLIRGRRGPVGNLGLEIRYGIRRR